MRTFVAIPCMDMVHTAFFRSMLMIKPVGDVRFGISASSLIYDARNMLAKQAIDEGCDRIFWIDSDMVFEPDILERLSADMDEGREFVASLCFKRKMPITPVVYKEIGYNQNGREIIPFATPFDDYPRDSIFEIQGAGFGGVMMSTKLIKRIFAEYGAPFSPQPGFGEDLSFCMRAIQSGVKLYCDSRVKIGHIANTIVTEDAVDRGLIL